MDGIHDVIADMLWAPLMLIGLMLVGMVSCVFLSLAVIRKLALWLAGRQS